MTNTASLGGTPVDQTNGLEKEIKKTALDRKEKKCGAVATK